MIKAGIIGGAGYTAGELIRLLRSSLSTAAVMPGIKLRMFIQDFSAKQT